MTLQNTKSHLVTARKGSSPSIRRLPAHLGLLSALLVMLVGLQFPFADGYRMQRTQSSCYYNGTHFMEGSIVPTKEPCLMCKCTEKTLICALKVCPEQPIPPPRGCILVHKAGSCCPYLQCSKLNLAVKNNGDRKKLHFLDYYEKAAQERFENPNAYLRRSDDDEVEDNGACIVNGTVYKSGSAMVSSTLCSYCYCINGRQQCVKPKCALPSQKCAPVFVDSACCPIRYDCSGKTPIKNAELATTESANHVRRINNKHYQRMAERRGYRSNGCTAGGHTYPDGEKMKSEDPCEVCYCIRGQRKCTPKKCAPTIKGCTPRVPRGECCAVRYDCKHGEQKPFGRKMEDEEESFDFFSILFGPDPDAPKEETKNVTEVIETPVTETAPVSTTSEKSFLDLLRAGLDFIDDAGEDELLLSTAAPSEANTLLTSTEVPPELQTVKVEIIQEPQAIYIEKPDFNFPVRKIPPVPIMFKPLPKIPTLLMNEPQFQNLESDSLLKENPTEVSNSLLETTVKNVPTVGSEEEEEQTEATEAIISTTTEERTTTRTTTTTTVAPSTEKSTQRTTTTTTPKPTTTTTTTTMAPTTTRTTTTTTTAMPTTTTTTTTTPRTTTTKRSTTEAPTTTTEAPTTTTEPPTTTTLTSTTVVAKAKPLEDESTILPTTTITPTKKAELTTSTTSSSPKTKPTEKISSTSLPTSTLEVKTTAEYIKTTTTPPPLPTKKVVVSEKLLQTTPPPAVSHSTPVDVVIKIDQLVDKQTVETILNSLNAKIEKVTKVTEPIVTTTIATKRPNNKFVGFVPEKIPTTVFSRVTSPVTTESTESTVLLNDPTTSATTEGDITSTIEPDVTTTLRDTTTDRQSEEITTSTQRMGESEESTTVTSTVPSETSTMQEESSAEMSTEVTDTTIANSYTETTHEELRTEPFVVENNDTATTTETITSVAPTKQAPPPPTRPPNPLKENNLLSVLLSGLSNIFDATKNDSGKQSQKNRTEYRPITPKPIPISGFHKVSNIPSILESDIGMDYDEPTLPPSLPNLKIIPFLPADAVKKNDPPKPVSIVPPTYTYFKNHPNNYPIVNDPYEAPPSGYGVSNEHEILHPGMTYKAPGKPMTAEYEYAYDPAINYPALTESYDVDAKNGYYNTKVIRDKYDTVDEMDYDYDTDTIHKYAEHPAKQDLFQNELKKFIPTKYEVPQEGTYVPVYDKYGVGYPEKNVYYTNHKELGYGAGAKLDKVQVQSTDNPLFRIDGTDMSGFSPPTKTEGGFVPKEPIKDEFYYESYATTPFPTELTDDHHVKLPYNATPTSSYGVTPSNPFIDVIRTEPAPPLMSLIEDKEKLLSTLQSKNTSLEDLLGDPSEGSDEYEKQIISITTDANYLSSMAEEHVPTQRTTSSKPNFTGFELNFPVSVHHPEEPVSEATKPASPAEAQHSEPEPNGMFSLENMLNYLLREEDPINENRLRNTTNSETTGAVSDGVPPFKTLPSRLTAVYDPTVGLEASLGDVKPPSDEELHDGTVTLKVESAKNDTKTLYRPSLLDLPFLNPGFHTKPINQPESDPETQNELDRYGYGGSPEHHTDQYQVIAEGTPGANAQSYVVNPVDINKLKQHHSEGTAEITMKSKVKDTVGILKLAGCNIYGRMYRVGRIISELSGPCLECKCTEVGVHCTPLDCRRRR
uniref:VWFC domain-containing protein n=1 Tax=Anopheles gambiae TaxID=7165 RepID=A0A1S4H144_ANOGA